MVRACYDCRLDFVFPDPDSEDAIHLCAADAQSRRLSRTFDNSPERLSNFAPSEPPILHGRPVIVSRTRVHTSKQEGLVSLRKERRHADV